MHERSTEAPEPALGHIGCRTEGPDAFKRAVARLRQACVGEGSGEGQRGQKRPGDRDADPAGLADATMTTVAAPF